MSQLALPVHHEHRTFNVKDDSDHVEFEELGLLPADIPPVPSFRGIPLKYIS